MQETQFSFSAADAALIAGYRWPSERKRAVVQIAHGMGEHAGRYRRFAGALVAAGYAVYANDHRGHGRTAPSSQALGDFGQAGFAALVSDMAALTRLIMTVHPGCPVILLGHSMGSFAAQLYLLEHASLLGGVILSGSAALDLRIAARNSLKGGFPGLNAQFEPARTPFDWLSRDTVEVDAYVADPLCGFTLTPASSASMTDSSLQMADVAALKNLPGDLSMYLLTGDSDPVNDNLRWFFPLMERYRQAGLVDVSCHVYGGARHEMLNETNRDEVTTHLIAWLDRVTA
jgi:alpha-beta hydrolase superfamily lysophospholipase